MVTDLYLFRHGQTDHNCDGVRYGGAETGVLTELGIAQAKALGRYLMTSDIDVFYSSPYARAVDTARFVAALHPDAGIIPDDRLSECAYWWDDDGWDLTDEQRARRDANFERVRGFFDDVIAKSNFGAMAIASHGGVTRALLMAAGHKIGEIKNCEMFHLRRSGNAWDLVDNKRF